jgi:hypothetical protein
MTFRKGELEGGKKKVLPPEKKPVLVHLSTSLKCNFTK